MPLFRHSCAPCNTWRHISCCCMVSPKEVCGWHSLSHWPSRATDLQFVSLSPIASKQRYSTVRLLAAMWLWLWLALRCLEYDDINWPSLWMVCRLSNWNVLSNGNTRNEDLNHTQIVLRYLRIALLVVRTARISYRFNPLALELDIYSLAHHLCKMWIFYEPRRVTLGNTRHFVEE